MRDCVFLLADGQMEAVFSSFLQLPNFHQKLGTAHFQSEFVVANNGSHNRPRNDPGVYHDAHLFLRGYRTTHRHAVVVLDQAFGHTLSTDKIKADIQRNLCQSGWSTEQIAVIVIEPELEAWIWQDHPFVQEVFYRNQRKEERARLPSLRAWLLEEGLWPADRLKPPDPKLAVQKAQQAFRSGSPVALYTSICCRVSVRGCQDAAFQDLCAVLRRWFPAPPG